MPTLDTISTVELIYKAFQENPTRITYSTKNLQKQFKAEEKEVKQAKELFKTYSKDYTVALTLRLQRRDLYDDYEETELWTGTNEPGNKASTIPASKFFDTLTSGYAETRVPNSDLKEMSNRLLKDALDQTWNSNQNPYGDQWEVKQKWVKGPEGSQLMVKKESTPVDFIEEFKKCCTQVKPYTVKVYSNIDNTLLIYLSDKHIGASVEDSMYDNTYNPQVFEQRMQQVLIEVKRMIEIYGVFNGVHLFDLGDSVDGFNNQTTRGGHILKQNLSNKDQFETYLQVHQRFLKTLVELTGNVTHHIITMDNHSGDFGYICASALKTWTDVALPQVKTKIYSNLLNHFILGNHAFIITHGKDDEDMKNGLPLYLNDKTKSFIQDYVDYHQLNSYFISVIKGDLHNAASELNTKFRYKNVPSLFGGSKWIANNFGVCRPGFAMDIIDKSRLEYTEFVKVF